MADDFNSLSQRLLNHCPAVGKILAEQFINDAWKKIQGRRTWSWRQGNNVFSPPPLVTGFCSTNVGAGNPNLITGIGTNFTQSMVGQQIRLNGLNFPYYDITAVLSTTALLIANPGWTAPDVTNVPFTILQIYYPVPADFGYFDVIVSTKDAYRLWDTATQSDLALLDPQRAQTGQTYAAVFRDYQTVSAGVVQPTIKVVGAGADPTPVSGSVTAGYTGPVSYSYIVTISTGGTPGGALQFTWIRSGQAASTGPIAVPNNNPITLSDGLGVTISFPAGTYVLNDVFVINAVAGSQTGTARYELWPAPSLNVATVPSYIYPYLYWRKEADLTIANPTLPPTFATRGDAILERALMSCARWPGSDADHPNPYFNLALANQHEATYENIMRDMERNDEEISVTAITYKEYPFYPAPWLDGNWQQTHAPFLRG